MKKQINHFVVLFVTLLFLTNFAIAQTNKALYLYEFKLEDNQYLAVDSIINEFKSDCIFQISDNYNSAVLRAFEQDNIGIVDLIRYANDVLKNRNFSYWSIKPDITYFSLGYVGYIDPQRGDNRISDIGNQGQEGLKKYYHKLFQSKVARDILMNYLTTYLVNLCQKYPHDFKKSILDELQNIIGFANLLPVLENIDTDALNGYWQGFIYRRYKIDNVPLDEILDKLNSLYAVLSNSTSNNTASKVLEIRINKQFSLSYSIANITVASDSKSLALDSNVQIRKVKNMKDNMGEYYLLEGFKGKQPCKYMFDKHLNEIFTDTDDVVSEYFKSSNGKISFLKSPVYNSEIIYNTTTDDEVGIVKESEINYYYFYVKTKNGKYGYLPKVTFDQHVVSNYSSPNYTKNFIKDTLLTRANIFYKNKNFEKAYSIVNQIKSNYPSCLYLKGLLELNYKLNYIDAQNDLKQYYEIYPNNNAAFLIGYVSELLKQPNEAIKYYSIIINSDNTFLDAYFRRGIMLTEIENRVEAIKDYDYIINFTRTNNQNFEQIATVYNNKAYALIALKKYDEAEPLVEKALLIDQSLSYIWDTRGELNYHKGNFQQCIEDMNKAISISESANSFFFRGLAKIKFGLKEDGCIDLIKAKEQGESEAIIKIQELCK